MLKKKSDCSQTYFSVFSKTGFSSNSHNCAMGNYPLTLSDRAEIFTTDRTPKMMRHMFEKKNFQTFLEEFSRKPWFSIGSHLAKDNIFLIFSDWTENFFGKSYDYISEVVLSFSENLAFFYFYKKNTKRFSGEPTFWLSKTL